MGRTGDWPTIYHFENQHYFHQMGFQQPRLYHVSCEHFFSFDKTFQIIFNSGGTSNPMNGKQTWSTIRWSNHHHYCCQPFLVHLLWTTNNLHQMGFLRPRLPEDENGATSISLEYSLGMLFGQSTHYPQRCCLKKCENTSSHAWNQVPLLHLPSSLLLEPSSSTFGRWNVYFDQSKFSSKTNFDLGLDLLRLLLFLLCHNDHNWVWWHDAKYFRLIDETYLMMP